ncbi:uncharacterized protein BX664DRAFT_329760 [Halteromyces radiatus]|uniref:uncharacterized protein n=1 Tax=Halteromyces radiatus TaxID=101107 RepID=UPI00221F330D|nr:uncharacterized protein BX664DRAFT_329760 [Halteromyces radiatus]KAI8093456.1 hypothetical protein BX664DRAFT_329760 [Halteromyces radiatus]
MFLSSSMDNHHSTYSFHTPCRKSIKRLSIFTNHRKLFSLRRQRKESMTNSELSLSSSSCSSLNTTYSDSSSSFIQMSDHSDTTNSTTTSSPENHPPAHVFGKADQGYSIFYLKLPNGNWMVRCRTADRKIIATYEVDGSMV